MTLNLHPLVANDDADTLQRQRRGKSRSNIFLLATLAARGGSWPVRIRNLSPTGALIEGGMILPQCAPVRLVRGSLTIAGTVMWHNRARAGIRFDGEIDVADWLPKGSRSTGQHRIDRIVHEFHKGKARDLASGAQLLDSTTEVAVDLRSLRNALDTAVADFTTEECATRQLVAAQAIDVVAQKLQALLERLSAA